MPERSEENIRSQYPPSEVPAGSSDSIWNHLSDTTTGAAVHFQVRQSLSLHTVIGSVCGGVKFDLLPQALYRVATPLKPGSLPPSTLKECKQEYT